MRPIIKVENLGKRYRIGTTTAHGSIHDALSRLIRSPLSLIRRNGKSEENTFWAIKDVSFEVMPGEVVGIIGRNGAGKSTLLKLLSRITEPTLGQIDFYGRVGSLLEVGTGFHPELTGRENIYLNGAILGMKRSEIERKFDEIVGFSEIEKFIDTPVKHFSSGMYVRLAFAVAAHLDPEILIVDEVLAVGDFAFQKKCLERMQAFGREGRTVIFVTHDMSVLSRLCHKGILLREGRVAAEGEMKSVIKNYLNWESHLTTKSRKEDTKIR
jgi:lipopolysaccharide transport system ATP-binding protein